MQCLYEDNTYYLIDISGKYMEKQKMDNTATLTKNINKAAKINFKIIRYDNIGRLIISISQVSQNNKIYLNLNDINNFYSWKKEEKGFIFDKDVNPNYFNLIESDNSTVGIGTRNQILQKSLNSKEFIKFKLAEINAKLIT